MKRTEQEYYTATKYLRDLKRQRRKVPGNQPLRRIPRPSHFRAGSHAFTWNGPPLQSGAWHSGCKQQRLLPQHEIQGYCRGSWTTYCKAPDIWLDGNNTGSKSRNMEQKNHRRGQHSCQPPTRTGNGKRREQKIPKPQYQICLPMLRHNYLGNAGGQCNLWGL